MLAIDISLIDLGRFVSTLKVGQNGRTVLLTEEAKIVGATAPSIRNDDVSHIVLKFPGEAGVPNITAALKDWEAASRPWDQVLTVTGEGGTWLERFHLYNRYGKKRARARSRAAQRLAAAPIESLTQ